MTALEQRRRLMADQRRSPRRPDRLQRIAAFRAWVMRQGAEVITLADARARLACADTWAGKKIGELVAEGVLERVGKGEWRLRGRSA